MVELTALITGISGFVGSNLAKKLLADGWSVHGITRPESIVDLSLTTIKNLSLHQYDGTIEEMIALLTKVQPTVVFHLASLFLSEHKPEDITELVKSNVLFGTQLIEAMDQRNIRLLVNTGTSWQHYESEEYSPVNLYAATKQAFEAILQYYVEAHGIRVITLKLFDTYGTGDMRPKLINLLQSSTMENQILVMSPGEQLIDLLHIDDVTKAFSLAAKRLSNRTFVGHERYAVSSKEPISLRELVRLIEKILNRKLPISWGGRPYRVREVMHPWIGEWLPGWNPTISLEQGLENFLIKS